MNGSRVIAKIAGIESTAERQVRDFNHDHGQSERGKHPPVIHAHSKVLVVEFVRNRKEPLANPHHPGFGKLGRWMLLKQHAHCRDEQEDTKNIKDEMKALHECDPAHDHGAAHDERAHNSPDQNAVLRARRNTKML
jgi:hypothetical protein